MNKFRAYWMETDIPVIEVAGKYYALNIWNGEEYLDCWEVEHVYYYNGYYRTYGASEESYKTSIVT